MLFLCLPQPGHSNRCSVRFIFISLSQVIWRGLLSIRSCGSRILCGLLRGWRIELSRVIRGRLIISSSGWCGLSVLRRLWAVSRSLFVAAWIVGRTASESNRLSLGLRNWLIDCLPIIRSGLIRRMASEASELVARLRLCCIGCTLIMVGWLIRTSCGSENLGKAERCRGGGSA